MRHIYISWIIVEKAEMPDQENILGEMPLDNVNIKSRVFFWLFTLHYNVQCTWNNSQLQNMRTSWFMNITLLPSSRLKTILSVPFKCSIIYQKMTICLSLFHFEITLDIVIAKWFHILSMLSPIISVQIYFNSVPYHQQRWKVYNCKVRRFPSAQTGDLSRHLTIF